MNISYSEENYGIWYISLFAWKLFSFCDWYYYEWLGESLSKGNMNVLLYLPTNTLRHSDTTKALCSNICLFWTWRLQVLRSVVSFGRTYNVHFQHYTVTTCISIMMCFNTLLQFISWGRFLQSLLFFLAEFLLPFVDVTLAVSAVFYAIWQHHFLSLSLWCCLCNWFAISLQMSLSLFELFICKPPYSLSNLLT